MEGDIYHSGRLVDPSQEFNLDLQHVLLGDYNLPADDFYLPKELKGTLFDEDEGFNEEYDDELLQRHATAATARRLQEHESSNGIREDCDAGASLLDPIITATSIMTTSSSSTAAFLQAGSHDQLESDLMTSSNIDYCYGNSVWSDDAPMQLISTRNHMSSSIHEQLSRDHMSSPVHEQLSREPSPSLESMHSHHKQQSLQLHEHNNVLPSHEELISMPFYKFKRLLDNPSLSVDDKREAKVIRKKGKNKSAAKHCRQRKMAMLEGLEQEVAKLQQQHLALAKQKEQLISEAKFWRTKCSSLQ